MLRAVTLQLAAAEMVDRLCEALFLGAGDAAHSIVAEAVLDKVGAGCGRVEGRPGG